MFCILRRSAAYKFFVFIVLEMYRISVHFKSKKQESLCAKIMNHRELNFKAKKSDHKCIKKQLFLGCDIVLMEYFK